MEPILSILIPTRNKYETLLNILPSLVKDFSEKPYEILVQDNSDNNEPFLEFLKTSDTDHIKYFYTKKRISVTENCDLAVQNSSGDYIILIGDDDYVMTNIFECIRWMKLNDVDCLNSITATYYWYDMQFKYSYDASTPSTLLLVQKSKNEYIFLNAQHELDIVIAKGGTIIGKLPRIYHGIVKRSILDQVFKKCFTYFPGPSPDMASSVAISTFCNSFAIYQSPFSISGKSFTSTSGLGGRHSHVGDLESLPHLDQKLLQRWDKKIPYFWSVSTIWAQSLSDSLKFCGSTKKINYNYLYSYMFVFEFSFFSTIYHFVKKDIGLKTYDFILLFINSLFLFSKRVLFYLKRKFYPDKENIYKGINSITEVEGILNYEKK